MGRPLRYRHVLYHSQKAEPVDVIVYRGKGFQEPWFLIVPPDSEAWLPTEEVVRLSATHANRAVFSRLEKPPGAARLAPAGAKIRAPAAGADGIHPRLFDRSAVRDRSVRRKAPPLLRSEEHTSELQSRLHLVCRLLLEKKKNNCACKSGLRSPIRHFGRRFGSPKLGARRDRPCLTFQTTLPGCVICLATRVRTLHHPMH